MAVFRSKLRGRISPVVPRNCAMFSWQRDVLSSGIILEEGFHSANR